MAAYRARRAEDAEAALAGTPLRRAGAPGAVAVPLPRARRRRSPFRLLHGDLVEANVVWGPRGPALVDWEFWRMGDPAEDLAYLAELNRLPGPRHGGRARGLRPARGRGAAWTPGGPLVALDAGGWYLREGMEAEARSRCSRGAPVVRRYGSGAAG